MNTNVIQQSLKHFLYVERTMSVKPLQICIKYLIQNTPTAVFSRGVFSVVLERIHTAHVFIKRTIIQREIHTFIPLFPSTLGARSVTLAYGVCPPPPKLKQGGQKYIFQFSRCESFHLVIQMSLVFCVNRCPYPTSFISIS